MLSENLVFLCMLHDTTWEAYDIEFFVSKQTLHRRKWKYVRSPLFNKVERMRCRESIYDLHPLPGAVVRQWDKTHSCYGSRQILTSPSDSVLCPTRITEHARFHRHNTQSDEEAKVCRTTVGQNSPMGAGRFWLHRRTVSYVWQKWWSTLDFTDATHSPKGTSNSVVRQWDKT